jgi:hypothetical protein
MRETFAGYYTPSEEEFAQLWAKGRIVVDANVLLTVYGVSPLTRDALLKLLESLKDRLWIPHQFALEYQRNRLEKILEQIKHYEDAHKNLKTILDEEFRSRTRHPFVSDRVESGLENICGTLLEGKIEQERLLSSDPYFGRVTELFEGKVGRPYSETELSQTFEIARRRFSERVPPGFQDADKPEPARFGDYVGWRQILDFAVKNNTSLILVTDDSKDDWWRRERGRTFGPRPELAVEFRDCCSGLFYMYSSDRFLELSAKYLGSPVDPNAVSELKERRESEPPPDAIKASAAPISEGLGLKPTGYSQELDPKEKSTAVDAPKLTDQIIEKPEGK